VTLIPVSIVCRSARCLCPWFVGLGTLAISLAVGPACNALSPEDKNRDRPKLPYNMMGLQADELEAYESKAEPVAAATAALVAVNRSGWEMIHRYFPAVGVDSSGPERKVHPDQPMDARFFASYVSEDAVFSPMPLLCAVWSLPESELSGRLKALHDVLAPAMMLENYSEWKLDDLRIAVNGMTNPAKTAQGVRYRTPKPNLQFRQALRLYAMTIALVRMETKWADKADSPVPDMVDFTNRLRHQLPVQIGDGETATLFLYRPWVINQPISKQDFEERADVVTMTRKGTVVEFEQFPVYLTVNQKEWNPSWIEAKDETNDTTLLARKYEHDWTRLDGPFLWFRPDQLNGAVTYRATVRFEPNEIVIEAERAIASRGAVKRVPRSFDYDPAGMTAFLPDTDTPATAGDSLIVERPSWEDQVGSLKRPAPYFSNSFRAWCAYGLSSSGLAPDGKTWVVVPVDEPRQRRSKPEAAVQLESRSLD
jgi:hypothetical protein